MLLLETALEHEHFALAVFASLRRDLGLDHEHFALAGFELLRFALDHKHFALAVFASLQHVRDLGLPALAVSALLPHDLGRSVLLVDSPSRIPGRFEDAISEVPIWHGLSVQSRLGLHLDSERLELVSPEDTRAPDVRHPP